MINKKYPEVITIYELRVKNYMKVDYRRYHAVIDAV